MDNKTTELTLNNMQKKIAVRDIVLVRDQKDEIGKPFLITFAEQTDSFMCAIRILPAARTKNELVISSDYFKNPKTPGYGNGGYVNVYTGVNTIRRHNVTTWISSLDNDAYIKIVYSLFAGMLGYYSTNGKFHLPTQIPLSFNINVSLLGAMRNSGIQQKNGDIYVPHINLPNAEASDSTNKEKTKKAEPEVKEQPEEGDEPAEQPAANDGWNNPPANTPDPVIVATLFNVDNNSDEEPDCLLIDQDLVMRNGLDPNKYKAILSVDPIEIYIDEFIDIITYGNIDINKLFTANKIGIPGRKSHMDSLVKLCKDLYENAKSKIE